jgi:hypothetical protein
MHSDLMKNNCINNLNILYYKRMAIMSGCDYLENLSRLGTQNCLANFILILNIFFYIIIIYQIV